MKISDLPFAVLRFQYRLARFPFEFIEQRVVARMDSEAPGRLLYERSLATVDVTVGSLLGASELEERGATLAERSDALRKAAELDASAKGKVRRAEQEFKAKRDEAIAMVGEAAVTEHLRYLRVCAMAFKLDTICLLRMSFVKRDPAISILPGGGRK